MTPSCRHSACGELFPTTRPRSRKTPCTGRRWPGTCCTSTDLEFGDPNGLTKEEKDHNGDVLRAFARENAELLGFDLAHGAIEAPSFHPSFHTGKDGKLFVNMVVELVQTTYVPFANDRKDTFPMRNGVTLLIAQDPGS